MPVVRGNTFIPPSYQIPSSQAEIGRLKWEELALRRNQNVLVEEPHIQSLAALALLIKQYITIQSEPYESGVSQCVYKRKRKKFIDLCLKRDGELRCFKCNHLLHNEPYNPNTKRWRVTIDHIIEIRLGGSLTDMNNMRLSCGPCNSSRNDGWDAEELARHNQRRIEEKSGKISLDNFDWKCDTLLS